MSPAAPRTPATSATSEASPGTVGWPSWTCAVPAGPHSRTTPPATAATAWSTTSRRCAHLEQARLDLLGHSAGANVATQYAARYPERVGRLALIGPGTRAVGIEVTGEARRALARLREGEPWFPAAFAALEAIGAGTGSDWEAVAPFFWGRWDAVARQHHAAARPGNEEAVAFFGAEGAFDPPATRAALAACRAPVLLLTGEFDLNSPPAATAEFAGLFPDARLVVQPGAGHYPWLDDAGRFVATVAAFLG